MNWAVAGLVYAVVYAGLVSALSERARESGVTVSEYLRGVVREKVGLN